MIFLHFPQVCYHKKLRFPLFLPLWGKTRETFFSRNGGSRHAPATTIMTEAAKTEEYTAGSSCGAYIERYP